MRRDSRIESVMARQVLFRDRYPAIEATVITENGACGVAVVATGTSVGKHEVQFVYDGGERWGGRGVMKAVSNVSDIIAPALKGADATKQRKVDEIKHYVDDLRVVLNSASVLEQKAFLRSFVKRIDVSKSDVTINYTLPMPPLNDYRETVGVLGFKQNGGRYWI